MAIDPTTGQFIQDVGIPGGVPLGGTGAFPGLSQTQVAANQPFIPPTGLIGSEQALSGGLQAALTGIETGFGQARTDLGTQFGLSTDALQAAQAQAAGFIGQGQGAISGAQAQGQQFINQGLAGLQRAQTQGLGAIGSAIDQGVGGLQGFIDPGQQAQQRQAALSGAFGPEAQAAAFQAFQASPGQAFLVEEAERATTRNAAAIGGLGGGNVRRELQRQAIGLAQRDFQNQFNNLGQVTGQGLQAAGQVGALRGQQAGLESGLIGQLGTAQAGLQGQGVGIAGQLGAASAGLSAQGASIAGQLGAQEAQGFQNLGINLGNLGTGEGLTTAQLITDASRNIAGGRSLTGQQIAQAAGGTAAGLANLQNQLGQGVANQFGQTGTNLANLVSGVGQAGSGLNQNLATLLANIGTGSASNAALLTSLAGTFDAAGILATSTAVQSALTDLISLIPQGDDGALINQQLANATNTITPA